MSATAPIVKKLTPILLVDRVEPCLPFWTNLGFEKTVEVPEAEHPERVGFAILVKGEMEVMYQTHSAVEADLKVGAPPLRGTMLYLEVDDLGLLLARLGAVEVVVPRRRTFYGADEVFVREPGGNLVGFAAFPKA